MEQKKTTRVSRAAPVVFFCSPSSILNGQLQICIQSMGEGIDPLNPSATTENFGTVRTSTQHSFFLNRKMSAGRDAATPGCSAYALHFVFV